MHVCRGYLFAQHSTVHLSRDLLVTFREALAKETMSAGSLFESSRTAVPVRNAGGATHYTEIDTKADRDTRAILEKNIRMNE